ncbi:MAG: NAD-dependent epimerase/dehydratase family protein [Prevotellaceae bacterium]|jgi:nucleoside-diphosphate-sugar epimerase|nr:NAD-dependent epimerase/dehydratase family protein [Prevotellaceae bacterium]
MQTLSYYNPVVQNDLDEIIAGNFLWNRLKHKSVLITGINGMLAACMVYTLFHLNKKLNLNVKITGLARNREKAEQLFSAMLDDINFEFLFQDVNEPLNCQQNIDFIIHAAGSASAFAIVNDPVGTVKANTVGTFNIMELARQKRAEKVLFTSSREVYGRTENIPIISETDFGAIDPLESRSCYPESKRMAEAVLKAYQKQFGINFVSVRIAHAYGPGMKLENDGRIMSDLMSNIINNQDITLKSTGEALRSFCYITDAVKAIFLTLLEGKNGEAYNIANETEEISINDLAALMITLRPEKKLKIKYEIPKKMEGYLNYRRTPLNTDKIERLGWQPTISLKEGIERTLNSFEK